jgi:RNA polymerase sigma-70 factor (ECF subfamily)
MSLDEFHADAGIFGDPSSREAFEQFTRRLIGLARNHLHAQLQHKVDPEDVVQSAYKSFFLRYGGDEIAAQPLDSLWSLLSLITLRKCADRVRHFRADCRDLARETATGSDSEPEPWRDALGREPLPEHALALSETVERVLGELEPAERPIIELGRAERSVRRVRERVKRRLECS